MNRSIPVFFFLILFLFACEEGEILPGVSVEDCDGAVSLVRATPARLYIGVEHTLILNAPDGNIDDLEVSINDNSAANATLAGGDGAPWTIQPATPGELQLDVTDADGKQVGTTTFNVRRIPDPVARVSNSSGGSMSNGEFRAQGGVGAFLDNFEFDARCDITGFELVYVAARQDPIPVINVGARYTSNAMNLIQRAKPGDLYYFTNVRARCPGDVASREINSMVFNIR